MAEGLLDFIKTPEGQGLLSGLFGYAANARQGTPWNNLGRGGVAGLMGYGSALERQDTMAQQAEAKKLRDLQIQQAQGTLADAQAKRDAEARQRQWQEGLQGVLGQKVYGSSDVGPTMEPDTKALNDYLMSPDSPYRGKLLEKSLFPEKPEAYTLGEGQVRYQGNQIVARGPDKQEATPSEIKGYQLAQQQGYKGTFLDYQLAQRKAGAGNTVVKVENKMGDSVAGQIGPMAKDSYIQTQGAVKMFDAATRLENALNTNKVTAGPMASQILTVKQFAQVVGGGSDDGIRQTRQAIKSLAQMSVEARKQLQGQGQVTDSEGAAVAKADSGNIDDLTTGELRDLVNLTKRAAALQAQNHQKLLTDLESTDSTKPTSRFYRINGMDTLLKHSTDLPKIGGSSNVIEDLVNKHKSK